jgi:hypothetical protein
VNVVTKELTISLDPALIGAGTITFTDHDLAGAKDNSPCHRQIACAGPVSL